MQIFLVGGAVRDYVLGREIKDRDFVVVGATEQEMLDQGFKKVGADFPVFLHPVSGEEFALARRERKVAAGYNGFECQFDASVTLEDDLVRRDLTMNAMAVPVHRMSSDGTVWLNYEDLKDPHNGRQDIQDGVLRHVSTAFAEDPVRVLRVARFAARYSFMPAKETIELMQNLVQSGELDHLVAERVWSETERALGEANPLAFFATLDLCGALKKLFPEVTLDQRFEFNLAACSSLDVRSRFTLVTFDLPLEQIEPFCQRVNPPVDFTRLAMRVKKLQQALYHPVTGESAITTLESIGAFQQPDEALAALEVCKMSIDNLGVSFARRRRRIANALPLVTSVRFADLRADQRHSLKGPAIGQALRELRVNIVAQYLWREGLGQ